MSPASWTAGLAGLFAILLLTASPTEAADYLLHRGDVLKVRVTGMSHLTELTSIKDDGQLALWDRGGIRAVGLSVQQVREQVHGLLNANEKLPSNAEVIIEIVAYSPVVIIGDVGNPGKYPYTPGLSVRAAMELADTLSSRDRNLMGEATGAGSEIARLSVEVVTQAARVARLQASLDGQGAIDISRIPVGMISPSALADIIAVERQQLNADQETVVNKKTHLERLIGITRDQIASLNKAQEEGVRQVDQMQKDSARSHELLQKGLIQMSRLEEHQRAMSSAQFQLYDVMGRVSAAKRDLQLATREMQDIAEKRRTEILDRLEEAVGRLAGARAQLDMAQDRRQTLAAIAQPKLLQSNREGRKFLIVREEPDGSLQRLAATEDTELLPKDTLEVSFGTAAAPRAATTAGPAMPSAAAAAGVTTPLTQVAPAAGARPGPSDPQLRR
jgi:protein involved in polysaccharide export with SLBB domain